MTSHHLDNVSGMLEAINRRRAKYAREKKLRDKHSIIDLTTTTDLSQQSPQTNNNTTSRTLKATIGRSNPAFFTIREDKGIADYSNMEDEYSKYDSEFDGNADQFLIDSGATIIDSRIELTDYMGRNRTLVRRSR